MLVIIYFTSKQNIYFDTAYSAESSKLFCCTDTNSSCNASSSMAAAVSLTSIEQSLRSSRISGYQQTAMRKHSLWSQCVTYHLGADAFSVWTLFRAVDRYNLPSNYWVQPLEPLALLFSHSCWYPRWGYWMQQWQGHRISWKWRWRELQGRSVEIPQWKRGDCVYRPFPVPHFSKKSSSAVNSGLALSVGMQYLELELISYWPIKIRCSTAPDGMQLVFQYPHARPFFDEVLHYS